jgi:hypothetical protein
LHRANSESTLLLLAGVGHDRATELEPHLPRIIAWLDRAVRGFGAGPSPVPAEAVAAGGRVVGDSGLCSNPVEN